MNTKKFLLLSILFVVTDLFSQTNIILSDRGTIKSVDYSEQLDSTKRPRSAKDFFRNILKIKECDSFIINKTVLLDDGDETYNQYYNDIKVEGAGYTLHFDKNGFLQYAHGNYLNIDNINTVPSISYHI